MIYNVFFLIPQDNKVATHDLATGKKIVYYKEDKVDSETRY
jgi:hypothetical protein